MLPGHPPSRPRSLDPLILPVRQRAQQRARVAQGAAGLPQLKTLDLLAPCTGCSRRKDTQHSLASGFLQLPLSQDLPHRSLNWRKEGEEGTADSGTLEY
jgi:hypothetical protein